MNFKHQVYTYFWQKIVKYKQTIKGIFPQWEILFHYIQLIEYSQTNSF